MQKVMRRIIRVSALDSPNVRRELMRQRGEPESSWPAETPGVLTWDQYVQRLATWDAVRQCIGLSGCFYEGAEVLLYPPDWLNRAEQFADTLRGKKRQARAIGIDPAEGGDSTCMAAVDELGLIELVSRKTPDTSVITAEALAFLHKHAVPAEMMVFDRGGGGKEHADRLRSQGYDVRTVAFGESLVPDPRRGRGRMADRVDQREERYQYKNRRSEMAGNLRLLLDPSISSGFGLPAEYTELRRQLAVMPLEYDPEGRMTLPPKNKKDPNSKTKTLVELVGHSPDEFDALCLAVWAMQNKPNRARAGAM